MKKNLCAVSLFFVAALLAWPASQAFAAAGSRRGGDDRNGRDSAHSPENPARDAGAEPIPGERVELLNDTAGEPIDAASETKAATLEPGALNLSAPATRNLSEPKATRPEDALTRLEETGAGVADHASAPAALGHAFDNLSDIHICALCHPDEEEDDEVDAREPAGVATHAVGLRARSEAESPETEEPAPAGRFKIPERLEPLLPSAREDDRKAWTGRINLHLHSVYSDGTMTPEEVVKASYVAGVRIFSLTDHDTVAGIEEALKAVADINRDHPDDKMYLYTGAELTARGGVHIGAIGLDIRNPKLIAHLELTRMRRYERSKLIVDHLNALPELREKEIVIDMKEVIAKSKHEHGGTIEIPHIARVLVDKGLIRREDDAYRAYLTEAAIATTGIVKDATVAEVLDVIRAAGGMAILNHPYTIREKTEAEKNERAGEILGRGKALGIAMGIEAYRPSNARSDSGIRRADIRAAKYLLLAEEHESTPAPGADFHGKGTRLNHLVVWMPKVFGERIRALLQEINDLRISELILSFRGAGEPSPS